MKPSLLLLFPAFGLLLPASSAQQAPPALHVTTPTTWEADWAGEADRVYFAEWSADLENWVYLPTMKFGEEMHGIGAEVSEGKGFLRLNYYDDPSLADLEAAKAADFDEDGISNWEEVTGTSTNPTNGDTDGDGLPDGWETAHGLDPNDDGSTDPQNGASGSFQGGLTTNGSAHSQGVQSNPNATLADRDGDGLGNGGDAEPDDGEINWEKTPEASYVWLPQVTKTGAAAVSKHGHILFPAENGGSSDLAALQVLWDSNTSGWVSLAGQSTWSGSGYRSGEDPDIFAHAWKSIDGMNDQGIVVGRSEVYGPYEPVAWVLTSAIMKWHAAGTATDQYAAPVYIVPGFNYIAPWGDLEESFMGEAPRIADDGTVGAMSSHVSYPDPNGDWIFRTQWVTGGANQTGHSSGMAVWAAFDGYLEDEYHSGAVLGDDAGLLVEHHAEIPETVLHYRNGAVTENLEGLLGGTEYAIRDTDIGRTPATVGNPAGRVWISVKQDSDASSFLEKRAGGSDTARWHKPPSMAEGAIRLNARGEAITPTKVWRNGSYTLINDLVTKAENSDLSVTKLIDLASNGIILAEATEDGVTKTGLLIPVEVSWKEFAGNGNVSDHIDPWITPETTNGKRIFPCAKNPDEPAILDKLELVVKTLPSQAGKTAYVKAFDVDDSTSESFDVDEVIDSHNKAGDDNLEDYKLTPKKGQFWTGSAWGNNESNAVIDSNGEARFTFGVGMQPGNNYRVVVSLDDATPLASIQVTDPEAPHYLGSEPQTTTGLPVSPLLTVWRRLWVENDSMEAIPVD